MVVNEMQVKGLIDISNPIIEINDIKGDNLRQNLQFLVVFHRMVSAYQVVLLILFHSA